MHRIYISFLFLILSISSNGQNEKIKALEDTIYNLNNNQKYEASIQILNNIISDSKKSNEEKYFANLFMSFTHKRLFNYDKVFKCLNEAEKYGKLTSLKDNYTANIQCQKALAYFDTNKYNVADSIMTILSKNGYKHLNEEYVSKINMQEAYLLYLYKKYNDAEKKYNSALILLAKSSPCDLPMIYAKQMDLYAKMGKSKELQSAMERSIAVADSCKILKYKLYTFEIFGNIEIENRGLSPLMGKIDSIRRIYNSDEKLKTIKEIEKEYQENLNAEKIKNKNRQILLLSIILLGLLGTILGLYYFMQKVRKQKNLITHQNSVNEQLISLISHDIREPLLNTTLLLKDIKSDEPDMKEAVIEIGNQVKSVSGLLQNILLMKKIDKSNSNNISLSKPIIQKIITEKEAYCKQKKITIIDESSSNTELNASPDLLKVIIRNLLDNAIKFSESNSKIEIKSLPSGIIIQDFGVGIDSNNLKKIMKEPIESSLGTIGEQGNGMGLYLLNQLTQQSNIKILIDTEKGKGTSVSIVSK